MDDEKIGILGGTFDPPHNAHMMLARIVSEALQLDRVVFIPTGMPPHKHGVTSAGRQERADMVQIALQGHPNYEMNDCELITPGPHYTLNTLRTLKGQWGRCEMWFIIGGDSLLYLDKWYGAPALLSEVSFAAVYRPGSTMEELERVRRGLEERYGAHIILLPGDAMDISSTDLRKMAALGEDISSLVPFGVDAYIKGKGLYKIEEK